MKYCKDCGVLVFESDRYHRCPPWFDTVSATDFDSWDEGDSDRWGDVFNACGHRVRALDAEFAAENYCAASDEPYEYIGQETGVVVRDSAGGITRWIVFGEPSVDWRATEAPVSGDGTDLHEQD